MIKKYKNLDGSIEYSIGGSEGNFTKVLGVLVEDWILYTLLVIGFICLLTVAGFFK